jgi:hypothetical protein
VSGNHPTSAYHQLHQQRGEAHITPISTITPPELTPPELGHDDLHLANNLFFQSANSAGKQPSNVASSPSYLGHTSGSTPEMLGEMDTEPTVLPESWTDYVMGTGLLAETDCSTPALCDDDSRMDAARSEEGEMQLDPTTTTTTTETRLTAEQLHRLQLNWDQIPDMDLTLPDRESGKSRTMILEQMQPEQISRVMDLLLSWDTPINVKIVNRE